MGCFRVNRLTRWCRPKLQSKSISLDLKVLEEREMPSHLSTEVHFSLSLDQTGLNIDAEQRKRSDGAKKRIACMFIYHEEYS